MLTAASQLLGFISILDVLYICHVRSAVATQYTEWLDSCINIEVVCTRIP